MTEPIFCEAYYEKLCNTDPDELANLVSSNKLRPSQLTFAAEWLGRSTSPRAHSILESLALDEAQSALVREGAYYGLLHLNVNVDKIVRSFALSNSPGLRSLSRDYK